MQDEHGLAFAVCKTPTQGYALIRGSTREPNPPREFEPVTKRVVNNRPQPLLNEPLTPSFAAP